VVNEVEALWPEVEHLTVDRVMRLKQLLEGQETDIKYFHIKPILWEGVDRLVQTDVIDDEALWVQSLLGTIRRTIANPTTPVNEPVHNTERNLAVRAQKRFLESIIPQFDATYQSFKARLGDVVAFEEGDAVDFWVAYVKAPDNGCTRSASGHISRFRVNGERYLLWGQVIFPFWDPVKIYELYSELEGKKRT